MQTERIEGGNITRIQSGSNCTWHMVGFAVRLAYPVLLIPPNEEMIREHAQKSGFPANKIGEVKAIIDPTTAEETSLN